MNFTQLNLNPNIAKAIHECGFEKPTPIQAQSIPAVLNGKDLLASAETGSGKTAAFVLPALHQLTLKNAQHKPRVLILTPTRELATQITKETARFGKFLKFNIVSLVGGMPYYHQLKDLARAVDIVVATPGRLLDHMENKKVDLSAIEMLVLDEADRMLDMGFIDDVKKIAHATPRGRQTLLFSATVNDSLKPIAKQLLNEPIRINLSQERMSPAKIKQSLYSADDMSHKMKLLKHILKHENIFKALIFCETKHATNKLADDLYAMGFSASSINGDLRQNVRNRRLEQFRRGKIQFLVATDVAARGIDVTDVTHVINFDLPRFTDSYVHRIGRTGRAGNEGVALSFVLPSDSSQIKRIERYIGLTLKRDTIEGLEPTKREAAPHSRKAKPGRSRSGRGNFKNSQRKPFKKRFGSSNKKERRSFH